MRKSAIFMIMCAMVVGLAACGDKGGESQEAPSQIVGNDIAAPEDTAVAESTVEGSMGEADTTASGQTEQSQTSESQPAQAEENGEGGFEDNFAVDNETAAAFAAKIKDAVAAQDLEALADLTSFPTYVGFKDEGLVVNTREEFIELGAERIFTPELVEAIAAADKKEFPPSMAGFTVGDGLPGINFGVTDGSLGIVGINY